MQFHHKLMSVLCSSISTVFGFIFETALSGRHCSTTWHSSTSLCWAHWFFWVVHILLANVGVCGGIALKCLLSLQCDPGWKADYPEGFFCWFWTISVYDIRVWSSLFFSSMLSPQWQSAPVAVQVVLSGKLGYIWCCLPEFQENPKPKKWLPFFSS